MENIKRFDVNNLSELGIEFETDLEAEEFSDIIQCELEMRVGNELASRLSMGQIREFEEISKNNPSEKGRWIARHCPERKEVCEKMIAEIKDELLLYRNHIAGIKKVDSE